MLTFLADENFDGAIVSGLRRRLPAIDIVRIQDTELSGADDGAVLEWAAEHGRLLLTHDVTTMTAYAYERVRQGLSMPGVIEVRRGRPVGRAIQDILLLAQCSLEREWEGQVLHLPLR